LKRSKIRQIRSNVEELEDGNVKNVPGGTPDIVRASLHNGRASPYEYCGITQRW
jgi:hypothetical protein